MIQTTKKRLRRTCWRQVQGLPFFIPAYDSRRTFTISAIGRERRGKDLRSIFEAPDARRVLSGQSRRHGGQNEILQTSEDILNFEKAFIRVIKHNHPGGAYSYRLQDIEGKVVVFVLILSMGSISTLKLSPLHGMQTC